MSIHLSSLTNDQFLSARDVEQVLKHTLGLPVTDSVPGLERERAQLLRYINLRLIAHGLPTALHPDDTSFAEIASEFGHDSFLISIDDYLAVFSSYMQSIRT